MSNSSTHRLRRWIAGTLIGLTLLIVTGFGALKIVLARMPEYQTRLQSIVQERTGLAIDFRRLDARLRWYGPEVVFYGAVLRTPDGHVLASARRGAVSVALGRSLWERRVAIGRISLEGPEIGIVRTPQGKFQIIGYQRDTPDERFDLNRIPIGKYRVRDARLRFLDEQHEREPWVLSKVRLDLERVGRALRLKGASDLPESLGRALTFELMVSGDLERPQTWQTELQLNADALQLAPWRGALAPRAIEELKGIGSLQLRTRWQGPNLVSLSGELNARDLMASVPRWSTPIPGPAPLVIKRSEDQQTVATALEPNPEPLPVKELPARVSYQRVHAEFDLRRSRDEWQVEVKGLELAQPQREAKPARIQATWRLGEGVLHALTLNADHIELAPLCPLLGWLPEGDGLARLRAFELAGDLNGIKLFYARGETPGSSQYRAQAQVQEFGFAPVGRIPGIRRLSGSVEANERGGTLKFDRTPVSFKWPRTFRDELFLDSLQGQLQWSRTQSGWQLTTNQVQLANGDGRVQAQLKLDLPLDKSSPQIELSADAYDLNVRATPRYLPASQLSDKSIAWFDRAFPAGRVPHANLRLTGALRQFPFRDGGGDFLIRAEVKDLTLDYQPGWTPATGVQTSVEFHNEGMRGEVHSAHVGGIEVEHTKAEFEDFKHNVLLLTGTARGDVDHALRYLQTSPLGPVMGGAFMGLRGRGTGAYAVELSLPLKNLAARHVDATAKVSNAWLDHSALNTPLARLSGSLRVVNTQIYSAEMLGQWMGGPVRIDVKPQGSTSQLEARGQLRAVELARLLRLPDSVHLLGQSTWSAQAQLGARGTQKGPIARVDLDLLDTTVELPVPLHKDAGERRPVTAELEMQDNAALVRATFGDVRALARIAAGEEGWKFDRAGVRADGKTPSLPAHTGVRLEGRVETLVLDDWLALKGSGSGKARSGNKVSDWLRAANLEVGEFGLFGYRWRDVRGVLQAENRSWRVDVTAPQVAGNLQVPYEFDSADVLTADLERLVLPARIVGGQPAEESDPRVLPNIRAQVRDFALEDHGLGEFTLQMARVPQGVRIDSAQVRGASYEGEVSGSWLLTPAGQLTNLDVLIASSDLRDTLVAFNYTPFLQAKHAEVKGRLAWPGGLSAKWLTQAAGTLSVAADQGQLLKLEPGAGRVLGLFSLSALPRRLSLDFTDLTGEGLSFDTIRGDFDLRDGNAYTSNLVVSGPSTELGLAGRTGLEAHDYDQTVVVTGKLGASLPVAGALAGGPVVAAAVLLFSQIFKEPLKGITRGYYRITGSWEDPVIERIHGAQAKEAAEDSREGTRGAPVGAAGG
jgi:uncharacterized protein (TIGR02099 family)